MIAVCLSILLAAIGWWRLVANGYPRISAGAAALMVLAQSAISLRDGSAFAAAVLGGGIYAMATSAFLLAREQSVRGIIRAGGALAGAQIAMPFAGLFTVAVLPALIAPPASRDERSKSLGVFVLLLFMPLLGAFCVWTTPLHSLVAPPHVFSIHDVAANSVLLVFIPALTIAGLEWTGLIPVVVGTALLIAVSASAAMGHGYAPCELTPAAAWLLLIGVSEWPPSGHRSRNALLLTGGAAATSWLAFLTGWL